MLFSLVINSENISIYLSGNGSLCPPCFAENLLIMDRLRFYQFQIRLFQYPIRLLQYPLYYKMEKCIKSLDSDTFITLKHHFWKSNNYAYVCYNLCVGNKALSSKYEFVISLWWKKLISYYLIQTCNSSLNKLLTKIYHNIPWHDISDNNVDMNIKAEFS